MHEASEEAGSQLMVCQRDPFIEILRFAFSETDLVRQQECSVSEVNVPRKIVVLASLGSCHCHGHSKPGKHHESVPCALTCAATARRGPS